MRIERVYFNALGLDGGPPIRIGGWLTRPCDAAPTRAQVVGHGYGGRDRPDLALDDGPAVRLFVCKRGFNLSASSDIPGEMTRHVLHGIDRRETYIHLGCAADIWAASRCLTALFPELADRIDYAGRSFGGGIGALAAPWDTRLRRIALDIPSFGHHPLRVTLPCVGAGEAVRKYHHKHGDVLPVLQYFDAAVAARYIRQPTLISAARFDPAVPPPGQVCIYHALPDATYKCLLLRDGGHFEYPILAEEDEARRRATTQWFDRT